jgi:hypothetical protein
MKAKKQYVKENEEVYEDIKQTILEAEKNNKPYFIFVASSKSVEAHTDGFPEFASDILVKRVAWAYLNAIDELKTLSVE